MAGFKALKDVCTSFDEQIQEVSHDLFSARTPESSEEVCLKKLNDFNVFSTKYCLLQAKTTALTPQIVERVRNGANIIDDYEDTVQDKILERALAKSVTQKTAVHKLLATSNRNLDPDSLDQKEQILQWLKEFKTKEYQLHKVDSTLQHQREEHAALRATWDQELGHIRELMASAAPENNVEASGPLYDKLKLLVSKMDMVSWLIGRLVTANTRSYDWISDPKDLLSCLSHTRDAHTNSVAHFISQ